MAVCERLAVSLPVRARTRTSRHCDSENKDADRDSRLLLASARRMQERDDAENQYGVLAGEVQGERGAGSAA